MERPDEGRKRDLGESQAVAERRRHRRFLDSIRVRYRDLEGTEPSSWGRTRNLSLGGLCLLTEAEVRIDSHLALEVHIENQTAPLLILGRVLRCQRDEGGHASGLEFIWVSREDCAALRRLADFFQKKYGETGEFERDSG